MMIGVTALMGLDGSAHLNRWNSEELKFQLAFIVRLALIGLSSLSILQTDVHQ
jgi:hypothetical protein